MKATYSEPLLLVVGGLCIVLSIFIGYQAVVGISESVFRRTALVTSCALFWGCGFWFYMVVVMERQDGRKVK